MSLSNYIDLESPFVWLFGIFKWTCSWKESITPVSFGKVGSVWITLTVDNLWLIQNCDRASEVQTLWKRIIIVSRINVAWTFWLTRWLTRWWFVSFIWLRLGEERLAFPLRSGQELFIDVAFAHLSNSRSSDLYTNTNSSVQTEPLGNINSVSCFFL